ncbi:MAG: GcvT family protein [Nocardioidaceae bacterium]|nr:GcvT family protein [Nocardioidaceae bacterium]
MPARARVVIIGGGVGGASVAFHLAELGETDVVLLERDELTSGSTFHSAGLVGQLRADPTLTRMNMHSVALYRRLEETDHPPGWVEAGGIKLASSAERLGEIRRQISWARTFDLPLHEISVEEAQRKFPLIDTDGVVGAAYLESDGYADPAQLCLSLAAGARAAGVDIHTKTRVLGIDVVDGRVTGVRTDSGHVECEVVINCGGMFAAEVARMAGVRVPVVPMSHQYVVTEAFRDAAADALPTLRDPDLLVYWRPEVQGLVMGGYERNPAPWSVDALRYDDIPADFNGRLLPPDWDRFEQLAENATRRVPLMAQVGLRQLINGPEAFTPDNEFCLGETEVAGLFVAAGFCAHGIAGAGGIGQVIAAWVVAGEASMDVWHMDVRRFGSAYRSPTYTLARSVEMYQKYYDIAYPHEERDAGRPLRLSPVYGWHRDHRASFGEKAGWERVNYYESNADAGDVELRPDGWAGWHWSPAIGAEHAATRSRAGLFDQTSFAKIRVAGTAAAAFLDWVSDNRVARAVGSVTYTQALNSRGGIECDFTVTRVAEAEFLVVTGTAFGSHDLGWLRSQAQARGVDVTIDDVTGSSVCFALWGPRAPDVLSRLTATDLSDEAFPFMTSRQMTIGSVPVRAQRVTFVGELGWELYASTEFGLSLWRSLMNAGENHGLIPCGYRAIDSLRLEKSYRVWGSDIGPETNPYEAGLGFCVKLDKPGGFLGVEALRRARDEGTKRMLRCLVLDDPHQVVLGLEPVRVDGRIVGRVTSGGYGYTVEKSLAYSYLPCGCDEPGIRVEVDLFGSWVGATVVTAPDTAPRSAPPSPPPRRSADSG